MLKYSVYNVFIYLLFCGFRQVCVSVCGLGLFFVFF